MKPMMKPNPATMARSDIRKLLSHKQFLISIVSEAGESLRAANYIMELFMEFDLHNLQDLAVSSPFSLFCCGRENLFAECH